MSSLKDGQLLATYLLLSETKMDFGCFLIINMLLEE